MSPISTPPAERSGAESLAAHAGMAVAVVGGALLRIAQHLVGLAGLFELFLCAVVAGIPVRMVFQRLLAIGALQLLLAGLPGYAEHFVIISFAHSVSALTP